MNKSPNKKIKLLSLLLFLVGSLMACWYFNRSNSYDVTTLRLKDGEPAPATSASTDTSKDQAEPPTKKDSGSDVASGSKKTSDEPAKGDEPASYNVGTDIIEPLPITEPKESGIIKRDKVQLSPEAMQWGEAGHRPRIGDIITIRIDANTSYQIKVVQLEVDEQAITVTGTLIGDFGEGILLIENEKILASIRNFDTAINHHLYYNFTDGYYEVTTVDTSLIPPAEGH